MCAIFGEINSTHDEQWVTEQTEKAFKRGKDLVEYRTPKVRLYHTRLATNSSQDVYPIVLDGWNFAMNGIIGEKRYKELQKSSLDVGDYTVDSAYLLRSFINTFETNTSDLGKNKWEEYDNDDYVFAFWMIKDNHLIIGSKDFPLYVSINSDYTHWRFSSFDHKDAMNNKNRITYINLDKPTILHNVYYFKNLIYITKD